jgi:long-chain fatty acid transport protein
MNSSIRNVGGAIVAATCLAATTSAWALGFANPDQDARATGQGEAFVAQADDASAIYYNPAGLTQLHGTEITSGAMLAFPQSHLVGAGGDAANNDWALLPHVYVATDFDQPQSAWRFGLGCNVPFGNSAHYGVNGPFKDIVTESSLQVINIEPTVAYQFNEHLSLGAGVDLYHGSTILSRDVAPIPFVFPGGKFRFDGDGDAVGGTVGLMWKITPQHTIGIVYHSPFDIRFRGNAELDTVAGDESALSHAKIQFPQSVAVGYAFWPTPKLKLEVDSQWTDWAVLDQVTLRSANPTLTSTIPFHWKDSWFYEFGAQYELNEHWTVRGGYIYSTDTVPGTSFSPTVPDSNRHVFSGGLGYTQKRFSVDLVYQYSLSEDRTVHNSSNAAADGTWKSSGQAVMVTTSVRF